jgi:hypothetical protein
MALSINPFLDKFSNDRNFSLPLPFMWEAWVFDSANLVKEINSTLNRYDLGGWRAIEPSFWGEGGSLVAQEVSIPSESYEAMSIGQDNRGGWMPGYGVTQRTDFLSRNLTINYLETVKDIETQLFRPWVVAIGSAGLLNTNLRATIQVREYAKDNTIRKQYIFERAFPTNVEGYTISYGDNEFIMKTVTFSYHKYRPVSFT